MSAPRSYADQLADAMGAGFDTEAAKEHASGSRSLRRFAQDDDEEDGPSFDDLMLDLEAVEGEPALDDAVARISRALRYAFSKLRPSEANEVTRLLQSDL